MQTEQKASTQSHGRDIDVDDLLDDPELERLHAERLAAMQREAEKRAQLQRKGHGEYEEACPILLASPISANDLMHGFQRLRWLC